MTLATKNTQFGLTGQYYNATNPTPGTGVVSLAAPTAFTDIKPYILFNNADPVKNVTIDYLRLQCTVAGTNGTAIHWAHKIDGSNASRYTSGGSVITPVNAYQGAGSNSSAIIYCGAIVAVASSASSRLLGHGNIRVVKPVIGDTYLFNFNGDMGAGVSGMILDGSAIANVVTETSPVIIGPGQWWAFHLWLPAQSVGSSYEFDLGYIEA